MTNRYLAICEVCGVRVSPLAGEVRPATPSEIERDRVRWKVRCLNRVRCDGRAKEEEEEEEEIAIALGDGMQLVYGGQRRSEEERLDMMRERAW